MTELRNYIVLLLVFAILLFISVKDNKVLFAAEGKMETTENSEDIPKKLADSPGLTFTILYDNYIYKEGTIADWGFSCLIEGGDKTILFDTGTNSDILWHNVNELGVDLSAVEQIVISHNHGDHTGGLLSVVEQTRGVTVYLPHSFPKSKIAELKKLGAKVKLVKKPKKIGEGVYLTGEMGMQIKEQSMVFDTAEGSVIVTGCSHQGIVSILGRAKEILNKEIYLIFGGFHLLEHSEEAVAQIIQEFRKLGVKKCGATHCTGDAQIQQFKEAFDSDYMKIGVGKVIEMHK